MLRFHTHIQATPAGITRAAKLTTAGCTLVPLVLPQPATRPTWGVTFDAAAEQLARLPRFFYEPDGSFAWFSALGTAPWRLEGNLYDRGDELAYVEVKGTCPEQEFNQLLAALGWPVAPLMFQVSRLGLYLDESDFRRLAATSGGAI